MKCRKCKHLSYLKEDRIYYCDYLEAYIIEDILDHLELCPSEEKEVSK